MFNAADIEAWASEYSDSETVQDLLGAIAQDRSMPQPGALIAGSPQRLQAESRQRQLLRQAMVLGYRPPVKELAATITKEAVKTEALGVARLEGSVLEGIPLPERDGRAAQEEDARRKKRERQSGWLGIERGFGDQ
ncbi:MAG: hypothetical protein M0T84_07180 [Betaproteobacteria bacterium]|nr:hypothetical protein [Betaproteobacteria bacterium]